MSEASHGKLLPTPHVINFGLMHHNTVTTEATAGTLSVMPKRNFAQMLLEEPSDLCEEVVTFKKVKSALCALCVTVYLLVSVCLYSQTSFISSCGTGCQRGL